MDIETIRHYALRLSGVTEDLPFGADVLVFRIEGKIFMAMPLANEVPTITLKLLPDRHDELRETYADVTPAFHWNKRHWSDFHLSPSLPSKEILPWVKESYLLVRSLLPKRLREKYEQEEESGSRKQAEEE